MKISAAVITFNEEEMIGECLKSVSWADEKVVIDSGSTDKTREIARKLGARIYPVKFENFSHVRNFAFQKTTGDWILYIDADERVTPDLAEEIIESIKNTKYSAFQMKRKNFYLGKPWPFEETVIRLFKKEDFSSWTGRLHESPNFKGEIGKLSNKLLHYTHRDITAMAGKTNLWSEIEADLRFKSHHPPVSWWRLFRVMATSFWEYYVRERGFKAGAVGLIESIYQSFSSFITYAKLWEKQRRENENRHL